MFALLVMSAGKFSSAGNDLPSDLPKDLPSENHAQQAPKELMPITLKVQDLEGKWVRESHVSEGIEGSETGSALNNSRLGATMLDPQTSGLISSEQGLWTISDASAHESQIQRLHLLDKDSAGIIKKLGPIQLSPKVQQSCFAPYLADKPDYEALIAHPFYSDAWITVTEDATRSPALSESCQQQFAETGSTDYPTLLVELRLKEGELVLTGLRAIQFDEAFEVGNFPNDGIEGLALGLDNRLYLGLEKDSRSQPRVFFVELTPTYFDDSQTFSQAQDAQLLLPTFEQGNHPINGMDIYAGEAIIDDYPAGVLIAAARNDNQLWLLDLAGKKPTRIVPLRYTAPSEKPDAPELSQGCDESHLMDNASLEGVAVDGERLFLINDPWKRNYMKNAACVSDQALYERMSPLLFETAIDPTWFKQ